MTALSMKTKARGIMVFSSVCFFLFLCTIVKEK